jgi:hypothetical protein
MWSEARGEKMPFAPFCGENPSATEPAIIKLLNLLADWLKPLEFIRVFILSGVVGAKLS